MSYRILLIAGLVTLAGCQRANRFPPPVAGRATAESKIEPRAVWGWAINDAPPRDIPIRFISADRPEWKQLPAFWNRPALAVAGMPTLHFAQPPMGILASAVLIDAEAAIKIKVPLGLDDPTPLIPACNPPTLLKWELGKRIFFDPVLVVGANKLACASCHIPGHGFCEASRVSLDGRRNTLSLLNVVYNRHQFWDGRVKDLEEVVFHSLEDEIETKSSQTNALVYHRWGGTAQRMDKSQEYRYQFQIAFGVERVTQDDIAKALATYLRTILMGDSLFDRAQAKAAEAKATDVSREHLVVAFDDESHKRIAAMSPFPKAEREALAAAIERGHRIYRSKGCQVCHPPGLFTNHEFANVLVDDSGLRQGEAGKETGRFSVLPIGLKDPAMRGAYRTPTLRNLSSTAPYFHTGTRNDLREAVDHFRVHLDSGAPLLAPPLRKILDGVSNQDGLHAPLFSPDDRDALIAFLLSLDGRPVDPMIATRPSIPTGPP